ncbi:endo-1,4-beta-xylanase [Plantactinospora siamensis]|uniref:Beta-xylanase n=1 Tax=Plantactinospora siamensis TaxID=555372 RepID=A0ABV6P4C0_9ACTN
MRSRNARARLWTGIGAAATPLAAVAALAVAVAAPAQAATAVKTLAEAQGRYFGTAMTSGDVTNSAESSVAAAQFDMVTPGNEMKWDATEPSRGSFSFSRGDQILNWGQSHGMRVRGHNLVWHSQLPSWVNSLPTNQVQAAMESHINGVAGHYRGKVYAWDVINEPFNEDGSLRQDAFYKAMGSGYLADALRTAHAADPDARLYINDYNIEGVNAKSNALYSLAQQMLAQGVPLQGIGLESHFIVGQVPSSLLQNMQRFAALGLDVAVTELDDRIPLPASSANLQQQGTDYGNVVKACLAVPRCVGISQWGVDDGHSWIPGTFPGYGAAMFYDANYQPKPAYNATVAALSGPASPPPTTAPPTTAPPTTAPPTTAPPTTAPPTTAPPTTTPPGGAGCTATYQVTNSWPGGFQVSVAVTNGGSSAINGWTVRFTLASGQTITSLWSGVNTGTSGSVTVRNAAYNGTVAAGGATSFGFTGTGSAAPATGVSCTSS